MHASLPPPFPSLGFLQLEEALVLVDTCGLLLLPRHLGEELPRVSQHGGHVGTLVKDHVMLRQQPDVDNLEKRNRQADDDEWSRQLV